MAEEAAAEDQETRTKIAFNLGEALEDPSPLFDLARAVEQALFVRKGSDAKDPSYSSAARFLAANIRRNGPLRRRVLDGELSPEALCELSPDELATDEMKRKREDHHRHPHGHDEIPLQGLRLERMRVRGP